MKNDRYYSKKIIDHEFLNMKQSCSVEFLVAISSRLLYSKSSMGHANGLTTREEQVLRLLNQRGSVSVEELTEQFGVSIATARRDLQALEDKGLLTRTHGGASLTSPLLYAPFRHDSSFQEQIEKNADEKRRIAAVAADLVRDGETIALTPGTTTTEVVRSLRHRSGISVVTNTVNVAMELSQHRNLEVFVAGGHLRGEWFSMVGADAIRAIRSYNIDKVFIGANGVDPRGGLSCHNREEAAVNRAMVQRARERIAVADHSKLGVVASHRICSLQEVQRLITDTAAAEKDIERYRACGIEVQCV